MIDEAIYSERPFLGIDGGLAVRRHQVEIVIGSDGPQRGLGAIVQVGAHVGVTGVHALHHVTISGQGKEHANSRARGHGEKSTPVHSEGPPSLCRYSLASREKWKAEE